jgi:hypothetical protein
MILQYEEISSSKKDSNKCNEQKDDIFNVKGCSQEIYFDANNKSQSGKWIPLDKDTGLPHQCQ